MGGCTKASVVLIFVAVVAVFCCTRSFFVACKFSLFLYIYIFCLFFSYFFPHSDVEDNEEGEEGEEEEEEDFGGPVPGDDGVGPLAAKKYFEEKRKDLNGSLETTPQQDENETNQSSHYKIMQWNHRTIRELYRTIQVLRQQREDLAARVKEQLQRKGLE